MRYFDLHLHPGLKTLFLPQDDNQISAWHNIGAATFLVGDILSSQSSLQQLTVNKNIPLVCLTLHPPEAGMLDQFVIKLAAGSLWSRLLNKDRLDLLINGTDGYQDVFYEEMSNLMAPPKQADNISQDVRVKFLRSWQDFDASESGTVHVVFNIEGGHALYPQGTMGDQIADPQEALANLERFLALGFLTLYLTPSHLTPNAFINHAYGNKILTKGPLLPRGFGITSAGLELIKFAYSSGLIVDVKHMSLFSRLQFYRIHDQHFPDKPIIASHAGLTGCFAFGEKGDNFLEWSPNQQTHGDYVQINGVNNRGLITGTSFYPLSINLFDEDVAAILKSGGLIGLSMDVRILGGKDNDEATVSDYLSAKEYQLLVAGEDAAMVQAATLADALWEGAVVTAPPIGDMPELPDFNIVILEELAGIFKPGLAHSTGPNANAHARLLANHLLQIHFVADISGLPLPWDNVCIGSDFDGLIEAVDCCKDITALANMAGLLEQELTAGAAELKVDLGLEPSRIIEQFCYTNAFNFFNKHFKT